MKTGSFIVNPRHLEHADAPRLSAYLNKNLESRLILRAPLFLEPFRLATCCVCKLVRKATQYFTDHLAGQLFYRE